LVLPSAGRTLNLDASDNDHVWKNHQAGSPYHNGVPVDGDLIEVWEEESGVNHAKAPLATNKPTWRSTSTGLALPCLDFDGTDDHLPLLVAATGVAKLLSDVVTNSTFTFYVAFRVDGVTTNASPSLAYNNEAMVADSGGYWGVHLRNQAGVYKIQTYNYSGGTGGANTIELPINLNTNYILKYRHSGGTLGASLNGGAETTTASGNTDAVTGNFKIAHASQYFNGRLGQIVAYNTNQSAQDQTDTMTFLSAKWL
jgi:hypothetical protein